MKLILASALFFLFATATLAAEYSVGVSPPIVDAGSIAPASSKIIDFYVVTISSDPLTIDLQPDKGSLDFFSKSGYTQFAANYSEQDTTGWTEFFANPVELLPAEGAGYGIRGARDVNFLLNVPQNAEPGYHLITVKPVPMMQPSALGQMGAAIVAITPVNVLFSVNGTAVREGKIVDAVYNNGNIETYFKNTGTVTIRARAASTVNGEKYSSATELVKPGEVFKFTAPFTAAVGNYTASTTVDYTTESSTMDSDITVSAQAAAAAQEAQFPAPVLIALILIIAVAIVIYKWKR